MYNMSCVRDMANIKNDKHFVPGCGSAWLERLIWDQEVAGSNPVTPSATDRAGRFRKEEAFCLKDWNLIELSMGIL